MKNKGYQATIITDYNQLTETEVRELWDVGVCMDDWDYMIILPKEVLTGETVERIDYATMQSFKTVEYYPKDCDIERLLVGCCSNAWYKVKFRGILCAIGVAYHA